MIKLLNSLIEQYTIEKNHYENLSKKTPAFEADLLAYTKFLKELKLLKRFYEKNNKGEKK